MLVRPSLIKPPTNLTAKEHATAQFQCYFKASTVKYLTTIKWFKGEDITAITNTSKHQVIQGSDPEENNVIFSKLNVFNVLASDEGNYSCRCYYNRTVLNEYHIDTAVYAMGLGALKLQGSYILSMYVFILCMLNIITLICHLCI